MSLTNKIIEQNLFNSACVTLLSEFQKRAETPRKQRCVPFWDFTSENVSQNISEKKDKEQHLNSSEAHNNFSSIPNMYDVNQHEVGMWLNSTPLDVSGESFEDVNDFFDTSILPDKPADKMRERKVIPSLSVCSSSVDDGCMDTTDLEELHNPQQSTLVNGNSKLITNGDMTSLELKVLPIVMHDYASDECKRDLTSPEKNVSSKRQCVESENISTQEMSHLVKSNLKGKFEPLDRKTKLENVSQLSSDEISMVMSNSLKNDRQELPLTENLCPIRLGTRTIEKSYLKEEGFGLKEPSTLSPENGRQNIANIEKKCLELKSRQMKQSGQCEWRKSLPENEVNSKESPEDESRHTSYSGRLRNCEQNEKLTMTTEFTGMMKNNKYKNKTEHSVTSKAENCVASKAENTVASKAENTVASKAENTVASKADNTVASKAENTVASKAENCVASKAENTVASKAENTVASKAENTVESKAENTVESKAENTVASKAENCVASKAENTVASKVENSIGNKADIEKKCLELKSRQMKLSGQCEWRKRLPENEVNSKESPEDESRHTSYSGRLRNCEQNEKLTMTTEFTGMMKNNKYKNKTEHSVASKAENCVASKAENTVASKAENTVASKAENTVASKAENCVASKAENTVASKVENSIGNKAERSVGNKAEHPVTSKVEHSVVRKAPCSFLNKVEQSVIPVLETPVKSKMDDMMVNLLVIGRNRNSELAVQRHVLEKVRSRSPEIAELIPPVDSNERTVNYSLDATVTFLRCLFSAPYNLYNWKVALESLSMAKVYNLPNLRDTCLQYLKKNFPDSDLDQVVEYARHFKIAEDFIDIEVFNKRNIEIPQDDVDKPRIFSYTCCISSFLIIDSSEFCISLSSTQQYMGSMFEADIKNELTFEAMSGMFCVTGIQIKLKSGIMGNTKKNVVYSVTKKNKMLISHTKEKPFKSLMIINFNKRVVIKQKEIVKISIIIEDIEACLCYTTPRVKLAEKTDKSHFRITLSSNKNQEKFKKPLFFIEKLFYTLNT